MVVVIDCDLEVVGLGWMKGGLLWFMCLVCLGLPGDGFGLGVSRLVVLRAAFGCRFGLWCLVGRLTRGFGVLVSGIVAFA